MPVLDGEASDDRRRVDARVDADDLNVVSPVEEGHVGSGFAQQLDAGGRGPLKVDEVRPGRDEDGVVRRRRLKRGVFRSIVDLQTAINRFIAETNNQPRPFRWVADPEAIIAAVRRGHQALDSIH